MNEIKPYIDPLDDRLAQMALCVTILILIGSLMLFNGNTEEDGYNEDVLGAAMVVIRMGRKRAWQASKIASRK